jgi:excinuclease ABC subunit C
MTKDEFNKRKKKLPDAPGVYFFIGARKKLLYIGKATSLRDRVRSYFAPDLKDTRGPLLVEMLSKVKSVDWREVDSVLEALILEANLIRSHLPPYNTDLKDDKSWNYVVITKEDFPRVLLVRGKELAGQNPLLRRDKGTLMPEAAKRAPNSSVKDSAQPAYTFGPFPHGLQLKLAMKLIRKIFPFRDTCTPFSEQGRTSLKSARSNLAGKKCKPCFNAHIGLCPGVCSGAVSQQEYRRIIRHIVLLFQGKKKQLVKILQREMKLAAKSEDFEEAARLRKQVFALTHIQDVSLIKDEYRSPSTSLGAIRSTRIEAYDMAHLRGSSNVGVMTVVEDGVAQKNEYRKFRIRTAKPGDDVGALKEVLSRRLGHDEWAMPRIIAVDGATAQINAAQAVLHKYGISIPVVGVVKDEKHRPREIRGDRQIINGRERDILLANAEAHRYAISYHRQSLRRDPARGGGKTSRLQYRNVPSIHSGLFDNIR